MPEFPFTPKLPLVKELTARLAEEAFSDHPLTAQIICRLLNMTFWASMQSEEGHSVRASIAFAAPEQVHLAHPFTLSDPIVLSSQSITKLSATFPFGQGAIGVSVAAANRPVIWGIVLPKPQTVWLLDILGPGYMTIRNGFEIQAAVLPDGSLILFDKMTRLEDAWGDLLFGHAKHTPFGKAIPFENRPLLHGLLRILAQAMIEHHRGGSVVFVNADDDSWREAVDFTYPFTPSTEYLSAHYKELLNWLDRWSRAQEQKRKAQGKQRSALEIDFYPESKAEQKVHTALKLVGGLTAVDGALVMTNRFDILGYGAKLKPKAQEVSVREWFPFHGYAGRPKRLEELGGTRHRSAAQFVCDYSESAIFVASQDGRLTIFCSDGGDSEVKALRVELLFL